MTAANVSHLPEPKPERKPKKKAPAAAQEAEAGDGYVTIKHCGVSLRIPVGDNLPAAVIDAFIEGGPLANWKAIRAQVGEKQWKLLTDAGMTSSDVQKLDAKIAELLGN